MTRKWTFAVLVLIIAISDIGALDIRAGSGLMSNEIGIGIPLTDRMNLELAVQTSYPNTAFWLMNEEDWQFRYHTTAKTDLYLDAFFLYNSMGISGSADFRIGSGKTYLSITPGAGISCEYFNGNRIGIDSKYTSLVLDGKVRFGVFFSGSFGLFFSTDIPLVQLRMPVKGKASVSTIISDTTLPEDLLYRSYLGIVIRTGGGK